MKNGANPHVPRIAPFFGKRRDSYAGAGPFWDLTADGVYNLLCIGVLGGRYMKVSRRNLRLPVITVMAVVMFAGCPLPYDYNGKGAGSSNTDDPSSPVMTVPVVVTYAEQGGTSGTIADGETVVTGLTTTVTMSTTTRNALIFYTDDGTPLTKLDSAKKISASSGEITITRSTSLQSLDIHAIAIGPNMHPSPVVHVTVSVSPYPILSVTRDKASISEDGGTATFTISSSSTSTSDITVNLKTGGDYTAADLTGLQPSGTSFTVTLVHSATTITLPITGVHDPSNLGHTVTLTIQADPNSPPAYTVGAPASASVVIQDDGTNTVTYDSNGSTGGAVPIDGNSYLPGALVTVLGNSGSLVKTGFGFAGWNTQADGNGTTYTPGPNLTMGSSKITLYAKWAPAYTVTYNRNLNTGGAAPIDVNYYLPGATVTVANPGTMVRTGYTFSGWNTANDGSGTGHGAGTTMTMGSANVTLYAMWNVIQYTLTVNSIGNGTTSPTGASTVTYGGATPIAVATVGAGYYFFNWTVTAGSGATFGSTGTATSTSASDTVILTGGNATVQANFIIRNYYVDASAGNDSNTGTTSATAFKTITKALSVATVSGQIVNVAAGTYNTAIGETFPLYIPAGVTLAGNTAGYGSGVLIQGGGQPSAFPPNYLSDAVVMGNQSVLEGFTITNNSAIGSFPQGVLFAASYSSDGAVATMNTITGNPSEGIYVRGGSSGGSVNNNIFTANGYDLVFVASGGNGMSVYNNSFADLFDMDTLGPDLGGGAVGSPGHNSFLGTNPTRFGCGGTVYAENNHWNHSPPTVGAWGGGYDVGIVGSTTVITTGYY
jgi:uncharacterized repeat protein (TIGR02543 family)